MPLSEAFMQSIENGDWLVQSTEALHGRCRGVGLVARVAASVMLTVPRSAAVALLELIGDLLDDVVQLGGGISSRSESGVARRRSQSSLVRW